MALARSSVSTKIVYLWRLLIAPHATTKARGRRGFRRRHLTSKRGMMMMARKSSRGRKQDRARVAGGQDYEVRYEAKKMGKSKPNVKRAVKKAGPSRKKVERALGH